MKKKTFLTLFRAVFFLFTVFTGAALFADVKFDLETGVALAGYNDVRIPGDTGTEISLTEDLETDPKMFVRVRFLWEIRARHTVSILLAPLTLHASGSVSEPVQFEDVLFPADTDLEASYRFNSWRLTYRYDFIEREKIEIGAGFTAKVRDAEVTLESDTQSASKANVGFVPLLNFRVRYSPADRLSLLLEADALAAPQGRAEDVLLAVQYQASERVGLRAGYRLLEGGADNDEVYNFALINFILVGATVTLF
jgi:hypothetical protein